MCQNLRLENAKFETCLVYTIKDSIKQDGGGNGGREKEREGIRVGGERYLCLEDLVSEASEPSSIAKTQKPCMVLMTTASRHTSGH